MQVVLLSAVEAPSKPPGTWPVAGRQNRRGSSVIGWPVPDSLYAASRRYRPPEV